MWLGADVTTFADGGPAQGAGDRHSTSAIVDEQTQMELYWPPFEGAVEAGVLSVMCANNLVNGVYVCENNHTENTILKSWGGFKGWVCSDYDGTRSTIDAANGGLDIAMPGPVSFRCLARVCCYSAHWMALGVCFAMLAEPSRFLRHNAAGPAQGWHCETECDR